MIWRTIEIFLYTLQFTSLVLYFLSLEFKIRFLTYITKATPIILLIPLIHTVWRRVLRVQRSASKHLLCFYTLGILLNAIGDIFLIQDIWESSYTIGTIFFIGGYISYATGFYPKGEGYQTGLFIQTFLMMLTCSICVFLIVYRAVIDSLEDIISCAAYLLVQCIIVPSYVAQPNNNRIRCQNCQKMGIYGSLLVCLSDYMLIIDAGYKKYEAKQGRDGTIPAFPLRNYVVMLTYYSAQFMIAWSTRQWSCAEKNNLSQIEDKKYEQITQDFEE